MSKLLALLSTLVAFGAAQQPGQYEAETHPRLTWQRCTSSGCQNVQGSVVLDSNWRWAHKAGDYSNCYTGNEWDSSVCSDPAGCAQNCEIEGVDYQGTYGIRASGDTLTLSYVTEHEHGTNVGSRVYLMEDDENYQMFNLLNKEFTFDVDVSELVCGLNGALYFIEMEKNGGLGTGNNAAGAKYGTGYCDAQCPHDMKWVGGEANVLEWQPSESDPNAGRGKWGACCDEMDIWEANSEGQAYTPHSCSTEGFYRCESAEECSDVGDTRYSGVCDKDGCDFSAYRMGNPSFYGPGKTVDTTQPMTVVTQFLTDNGSDSGQLSEIRRLYVQNGQVIENVQVNIPGIDPVDSITADFCDQAKVAFGDEPEFQELGGMAKMGRSLAQGHVLAMSLWDDHYAHMLWLDSAYPLDRDPSEPGVKRGDCPTDSGVPAEVQAQNPGATVTFSNIKFGDIGTTY